MLIHPARHYIHYLISKAPFDPKPPKKVNEKTAPEAIPQIPPFALNVVRQLGNYGLPVPQTTDLLTIFCRELVDTRNTMRAKMPPGFNPTAKVPNAATKRFLVSWGMEDAWAREKSFVSAVSLFERRADVRRALSVLLLGSLEHKDAAKIIRNFYGLPERDMNTRVVSLYAHYFWNTEILDVQQLRYCFGKDWLPGWTNDYLVALTLPRTPLGAGETVNLALRTDSVFNPVHTFALAQSTAMRVMLESASWGGHPLQRSQALALSYNVFQNAEEQLDRRRGGSADVVEELRRILQQFDHSPLRTTLEIPITARSHASSRDVPMITANQEPQP